MYNNVELAERIDRLTPAEQESVLEFLRFLEEKKRREASPFLTAAREFINQHPELLRKLAR